MLRWLQSPFRQLSLFHSSLALAPRSRVAFEFAPDSPLEGDGFEPSPRRLDSRFSAAFVALGRIKVDSMLDHFWTPANTD